jgi:hypothetical protein
VDGLDWLLYSVAIQSAERAMLEIRASSVVPLIIGKVAYDILEFPPMAIGAARVNQYGEAATGFHIVKLPLTNPR